MTAYEIELQIKIFLLKLGIREDVVVSVKKESGPLEAFLKWWDWVKISATMVGRRWIILKLHGLKRPKTIAKIPKSESENK